MENKPIILNKVKKFYDTFEPNYVGAFRNIIDGDNFTIKPIDEKFINKYEEFLEFIKKYSTADYTVYSCYRKLKPNISSRTEKDVVFHRYFFVDIDDPNEEKKFEDFIKNANLKYSFKVCSGGGFHYYFRTNDITIIDEDMRELEKLKATSSLFRDWFVDNDIKIDRKIIDLARYTRVFGTFNYKRNKYCDILEENELTTEEIENNTKFIFGIKPKYNIEFKSPHTICSSCRFVEKAMSYNFEQENPEAYVNDKLLKNSAAYLYENQRSFNEAKLLCITQTHPMNEIEGWWKKVEKDNIKFNCFELRKFCKESFKSHFKDTCLQCMLENNNKVLYLNDETLSMHELKNEYRDTLKLPVNRYYKLKGEILPDVEYKKSLIIAKKYVSTEPEQEADEQTLELEDLEPRNRLVLFLDEHQLTRAELNERNLRFEEAMVADFFIYNFVVNNKSYKLLSEIELQTGEAIIEGNIVQLMDKTTIGDDRKVESVTYLLLSHTVQSSITNYESWESVFEDFHYPESLIEDYIFNNRVSETENYILDYPEEFKLLIKAFLCSGRKFRYPLHLVIVGPQGTGKSWLINAIGQKFKEKSNFIGGGNVTIKAFLPSCPGGKYNKGFLYNSNLLLTVDEMFNIFLRSSKDEDNTIHLQNFNNILENLPITTGTAFGSHTENLTAKTIWVTNPIDKSHLNFEVSINNFPSSSMQRFLFFNMGADFIKYIRNSGELKNLEEEEIVINNNKWIMLMNFFMMEKPSKIEYDTLKLINIVNEIRNSCPESLLHLYETRLVNHHAVLLFEGLVKWRILFEKDKNLKANEKDYMEFKYLWEYIIKSWRSSDVNLLTKNEKIVLDLIAQEPSQKIYRKTLVRRAEKIFNIDDEKSKVISNIIKDLRNYGFIENGKKDDLDKQNLYLINEKEVSVDELEDVGLSKFM